jgi:cell division protein ZipA
MEDLRWILLLVGGLVVAAVYFSSRFEREDWVRERETLDARKRSQKKARNRPQNPSQNSSKNHSQQNVPPRDLVKARVASEVSHPVASSPRKEPQMSNLDVVAENTSAADLSAAEMVMEEDPATSLNFNESATIDSTVVSEMDLEIDSEMDSEMDSEKTLSKMENVIDQYSPWSLSEEGTHTESEEANQPEVITTSEVSEIPADVALPEESVAILEETKSAAQNSDDDAHDEEELPASSIDAGIEDEITDVDIPFELATAEAEIQIENHRRDTSESTSPQMAQNVNIEPLVLVITVMAEDEKFSGPAVREALEAEGLEYGDMRIFHYFDRDASSASDNEDPANVFPVFSVASLVEPGYFELKKLDEMEMPGLTLFCQLPGPLSGEKALEIMLDKGRGLAVRLQGQMCDDKHNRFTTQAKTHYQDRIATFTRKLTVAKKKAGV